MPKHSVAIHAHPGSVTVEDLRGLIADVSPRTLRDLERVFRVRTLRPQDVLVRQGQELALFLVLNGWLAVRRTNPEGRVYTLVLLRPGDVIGLASAWRVDPSMFDVVALTPATVASVPGRALRSLAERDAALAIRLFDLAMNRSMGFADRLDQVYFDVARKRLARILLTYEPLITSPRPIISRADLAGLIETSREMLGNAIRALETEGTIRRNGRQIVIHKRALLEREAELEGSAVDQDRWLSSWHERRGGRVRAS